ncbi:MAG TPA: homoserine kinase, partial [Parasegetibacter sp.]
IEPVRSILLPGFDILKKQCKEAGALGGGISGSGPSIFMWSKDFSTAKNLEMIMTEIYCDLGIDFHTYVTTINMEGVRELEPALC